MSPLPPSMTLALGYILTAIAGGFALYYWRRSTSLYALLVEGANRFEELRNRGLQLEGTLGKANERIAQTKEGAAKLERAVDEARAKAAELTKKIEAKEAETRYISEKLELQKGHLEKQLLKVTEQARHAEAERENAEDRLKAVSSDLQQRLQSQQRDLSQKLNEITTRLEVESIERARLEKIAATADPEEVRRLKRKIIQYDRLYSSMKGLREMAEERNSNWEVALRKLSVWIVKEKLGSLAEPPEAIGPLVGQALTAIGAQLIDDQEILGVRQPTSPAEAMPDDLAGFDPLVKDTLSHAATLGQMDEVAKILRG